MKIRGFITHKLSENFSDCQDRFRVNPDTKSIALSDGMSQSFLQAIWADLLCKEFTDSETWVPSDDDALRNIREEWTRKCSEHLQDQEKAGNPHSYLIRNAIRNNASAGATFLGVRLGTNKLEYCVLGDSCLIHIKNGKIGSLESIISSQVGDFDSFPDFLDSHPAKKSKGTIKYGTLSLSKGDALLLVSDPFSDFFYEKVKSGETCEDCISRIMDLKSHDDFERLVSDWRNAGMTNDDSTLIIIEYDNNSDFSISKMDDIYKMSEEEKVKKEEEEQKAKEKDAGNVEQKQKSGNGVRTENIEVECPDGSKISGEIDEIYHKLQKYDKKTLLEIIGVLCKKLKIENIDTKPICYGGKKKICHPFKQLYRRLTGKAKINKRK